MAKSRSSKQARESVVAKKMIDSRRLTWFEIYQEMNNPNSRFDKMDLLRQLSDNFRQGRYKNGDKIQVERYLCGFLNGQAQTNITLVLGCGSLDEEARREIKLVVFACLSQSNIDGATQGLIDGIKNFPPDGNFFRDVDSAKHSLRL